LSAVELAKLAEEHELSCFVAVLGNRGPIIVRWHEPPLPVTVNVRVGSVMPILRSATGLAFGAFSDAAPIRRWVKEELASATPDRKRQLPNERAVELMFKDIRMLRCAPLRDTLLAGVRAVAAPVFDASGSLAAAITALRPSGGFDPTPGGTTATALL